MQIIAGPYGMQSPHPYRRPHVELYREVIELAERAEQLGYDGIALTEHSFWYDGYFPSLLPVLSAIAQRTERIMLMTAALVPPPHDSCEGEVEGGGVTTGTGMGSRRRGGNKGYVSVRG